MSPPFAPDRTIALWLFAAAAAVFLMALLGAVTRLTESGLSIVEWRPLTGALPPLSDSDWNQAFALYKASPQYQKINAGMSLDDFKGIFFWEWLHRLWGRLIGLVYALPLAWFWARRRLPAGSKKYFLAILALGFLQGAMGWFMVKSGLVDRPAVSHYRLAAHLGLAFVIFGCLWRLGLMFWRPRDPEAGRHAFLRPWIRAALAVAAVTMVWGAFVAGLRAGLIYDTFPLMGGRLWPGEIFALQPRWSNFFENHATVQFTHRLLALLTFAAVLAVAAAGLRAAPAPRLRRWLLLAGAMAFVQPGLGIAALLTHVNIVVATLHQAGALILLTVLLALLHETAQERP